MKIDCSKNRGEISSLSETGMTKQLAGAALAVSIGFCGLLVSYKGALWKTVAAWLAVTKEIKRSGCLCIRGGGRHERLTLSSSSNDIFITGVLRHRLFNLNQEGKFRMAIAQHRRSIAAPKQVCLTCQSQQHAGWFGVAGRRMEERYRERETQCPEKAGDLVLKEDGYLRVCAFLTGEVIIWALISSKAITPLFEDLLTDTS